ncbi:hypothetical protein EV663_1311 [Rhodovulum bhavnagarense]|uniref:Uncharacterized protein n=1 Tax=Rhodovulum bhavnagarense TaxID=992286 RepID=A0A4R2R8M5_9RHOB|nr:hypothetical protein [Rhodovulum bhavnagarense]TCP58368.1 hypothetical protein EV663_1311 [Rhodovulum bhavnagarense]
MNEKLGFLQAVVQEFAVASSLVVAAWGALGGATHAITIRMRPRDAIRQMLLGGLIASGMGSLSMVLVARWLGLPLVAIPAGGATASAAYLAGMSYA